MATNPRLPDQYTPPRPESELKPAPPSSPAPGVILAIVVALLLLGAIFYFMPRAPRATGGGPAAATVPNQPVAGELQISHTNMTMDPTGQSLNLDGEITNTGQHDVTGILSEISFKTKDGQTLTADRKVMSLAGGNKKGTQSGTTQDLTVAPIKPGEMRAVRIVVDDIPANWNHQMPEIRFVTVTAK